MWRFSLNKTLLIASRNPGKVQEITAILSSLDLKVTAIIHSVQTVEVREIGNTYAENAQLKAEAYQKRTGMTILADDSGLEVDALNGAPGIYSARYSPLDNATDADRRRYLLQQLEGKPQPWTAHFHCTTVLAVTPDQYFETSGFCQGRIIPEERGTGGFGYDPVFYIDEYDATMAELPPDVKNQISHRANALKAMIPILKSVFNF